MKDTVYTCFFKFHTYQAVVWDFWTMYESLHMVIVYYRLCFKLIWPFNPFVGFATRQKTPGIFSERRMCSPKISTKKTMGKITTAVLWGNFSASPRTPLFQPTNKNTPPNRLPWQTSTWVCCTEFWRNSLHLPVALAPRMFGRVFFDGFNRGGFWDFGIEAKSSGSGKDEHLYLDLPKGAKWFLKGAN